MAALLLAGAARADFQSIAFPSAPAWYYVSLQVDPVLPDPLSVFPVGGGFDYAHIWAFDPVDGWRHFAPPTSDLPTELATVVNDLDRIEPLRGYWIQVTSVPSSSFEIVVEGEPARLQELPGAGWHSIGPLLPPGAAAENVEDVFSDLGPALGPAIPEAWRYDRSTGSLVEIPDFAADCGSAPESCMAPASGYWVRTTGDVVVGREFRIEPDGVVLSATNPVQRIEISYTGSPLPVAGVLRPSQADTGIVFRAAREVFVDESIITEIDPDGGSPDGPDTTADLDGDGTPEPCPDLCGAAADCVDLCFQNPTRSHVLYVQLDATDFVGLETFTSLDPGREFTFLEIDLGTAAGPPGGGGAAPAGSTPASDVVASTPVALKPPVVTGEYAGTLAYGSDDRAPLPLQLYLDDCTRMPGDPTEDCTGGRVTAIINPTLVGSSANGLDDDGDGDVDEPSEDGALFSIREGAGFPSDVVLHGSISSDNMALRLSGRIDALPDLDFAIGVRCIGGACTDGSGACSLASDCASYATSPRCNATCPGGSGLCCSDGSGTCVSDDECPRHGGIGSAFAGASRELTLDLQRTGVSSYGGSFVDQYETPILGDVGGAGRVEIGRVLAPQCVARDPGSTQSLPLGIACREDADCPFRCTGGDPGLDGFRCTTDADCVAIDSTGTQLTAFCEPFPCQFRTLGGASATALDYQDVSLSLDVTLVADGGGVPGEFDRVVVEVVGTDVVGLATSAGQSIDLGELACGSYQVRVSGPNCAPVTSSIDVCDPVPPGPIPVTCVGAAQTPTGLATSSSGGAFTVAGGPAASGPTDLQLVDDLDAACTPAPGVACIARWELGDGTPVATLLTGGVPPDDIALLGIGGQTAVAGEDSAIGWTELASWSPTSLRAGLRTFLASLFQ